MKISTRSSRRAALVVGVLAAATLAPSAAHATLPGTVNQVNWNVRHSWINHITNPAWFLYISQGTQARTASNGGTGTADAAGGSTSWSSGFTNTYYGTKFAKSTDSGTPRTVVVKGGLDWDLPVHGVDISIKDIKVVATSATTEKLNIDATYVQYGTGPTISLSDIDAFDVNASGVVTLRAAAIQLFEQAAGSSPYRTGDPFGTVTYS